MPHQAASSEMTKKAYSPSANDSRVPKTIDLRWVMPVTALVLLGFVIAGLGIARSWPLVHDAPLMHYVVFAMQHGMVPYRDIVDMNMPGTYVIESLAMHLFGGGSFGWWLWDALSGVLAILSSMWIAGPQYRWSGVAGASLVYLVHLKSGPWNLGQRDWIVAVLLEAAFACLFHGIRTKQLQWIAGFTCLCGLAASIKPPVAGVAFVFLLAAGWLLARDHKRSGPLWRKLVLWSLVGVVVPAAMTGIFLARWGVTGDFLRVAHGLVPYYASLHRPRLSKLLRLATPYRGLLIPGVLALFVAGRCWLRWESVFLLGATLAGGALFVIQGKGWVYHLYPELAFGILWIVLELARMLERKKWQQLSSVFALLVIVAGVAPLLLRSERATRYPTVTLSHLESDLNELGGQQLSGKVQCLDMTLGSCINALYRMSLLQSTGFVYDFYLFPKKETAVTRSLQGRFLDEVTAHPPEVIVLSSHTWPEDVQSYQQVANWPAFETFLQQRYTVVREYPIQPVTAGYKLYRLSAAPLKPQ